MMKDILEKLSMLVEAGGVKPGQRVDISFKLKKLDKLVADLVAYKNSLNTLQAAKVPDALRQEMREINKKLQAEIDKVQTAYDDVYEKSRSANDRPIKMENLFNALKKNCKQIIKVYQNLNESNSFENNIFLYRGIKRQESDAVYGKPYEARSPTDSRRDLHDRVNTAIHNAGFKADRSNSMFVSGNRGQASNYGNVYVMFPVDGFDFTWSTTQADVVLNAGSIANISDDKIKADIRTLLRDAGESELAKDLFYNYYNYENDVTAIKNLVTSGKLPKEASELVDNIINDDSIFEFFKFKNTDLYEAILSRKEIYVTGPYYAVSMTHLNELKKFLETVEINVTLPASFGDVPAVINRGDVVKVVDGSYAGKIGTVSAVYQSDGDASVEFTETDPMYMKLTSLESHPIVDDTGNPIKFAHGDKVMIVNPSSQYYGKVGTIQSISSSGKFQISDDLSEKYFTAYKHEVYPYSLELEKKLQQEIQSSQLDTEFKFGQPVKIIDPSSAYYNQTGTVYTVSGNQIDVQLGNSISSFAQSQIEKTKLESIEVGDMVKVIDKHDIDFYGKTGKVEKFDPTSKLFTIVFNSGSDVYYFSQLEKVESTESHEYTVGQLVKVIDGKYNGYVGKIVYIYPNSINVELSGLDQVEPFYRSQIVPHVPDAKFKVGDNVEIIDGPFAGKHTYVNYVSKFDPSEVDLTGGDITGKIITLPVVALKLITDDSKISLKVGDTVKITNPIDPEEKNKIGKISMITKTDPVVYVVEFNDGVTSSFYKEEFELYSPGGSSNETQAEIVKGDYVQVNDKKSVYYGKVGEVLETGTTSSGEPYVRILPIKGIEHSVGFPIKTFLSFVTKIEKPAVQDNEPTEPEPSTFNVGDSVKILSGPYEGKIGTVEYVFTTLPEISVKFGSGSDKFDFHINNVELVPEDQSQYFNIGDLVEVHSDNSSYVGEIGKIISIDGHWIQLSNSKYLKGFWVKKSWLKKANTPLPSVSSPKFSPGDKVKITDGPNSLHYVGAAGEIVSGPDEDGDFKVSIYMSPSNKITYVSADEMIKLTDTEATVPPQPLSVGDKVLATGPSAYNSQTHINDTGKITSISDDGKFAGVKFTEDTTLTYEVTNLKKINDNDVQFKIGDRVEVVKMYASYIGKKGTVTDASSQNVLSVELDGTGYSSSFPAVSLRKIADTPPLHKSALTLDDFSVGDVVQVTDQGSEHRGKTGKIYKKGNVYLFVDFGNDSGELFDPSDLKKI